MCSQSPGGLRHAMSSALTSLNRSAACGQLPSGGRLTSKHGDGPTCPCLKEDPAGRTAADDLERASGVPAPGAGEPLVDEDGDSLNDRLGVDQSQRVFLARVERGRLPLSPRRAASPPRTRQGRGSRPGHLFERCLRSEVTLCQDGRRHRPPPRRGPLRAGLPAELIARSLPAAPCRQTVRSCQRGDSA
jgi:hypothetical protein